MCISKARPVCILTTSATCTSNPVCASKARPIYMPKVRPVCTSKALRISKARALCKSQGQSGCCPCVSQRRLAEAG
eukprot:1890581-Rhodomonas_salina.1